MTDPKRRVAAPFWLGLAGMLGYALLMTKSRGGFLGLLAGLSTLLVARFGVKRAILPAVALTSAILLLVGGRQTDLSTDEGTGHQRIEIWEAGLELLRQSPAFGIGQDNYLERVGIVAHNSFVQGFVELGYLGGTLFVGAYGLAIAALWRLGADRERIEEEEPGLARLRPFLLAILGAEVVGQLSITRTYTLSTYLPLGLATAYLRLVSAIPGVRTPRCTPRVFAAVAALGLVVLAAFFLFVRIKLR
jgi:putative inorganic carbon (hco3(-)) transporter